jgi:hypothetical protein
MRAAVPYLLVVQSDALAWSPRRAVVPLVPLATLRALDPTLNPGVTVAGNDYALLATGIAFVPARNLGEAVSNLAGEGDRMIRALDLLIVRH